MRLIILNGNINAGKSTIGNLLTCAMSRTVHLEVDQLHHFLEQVEGDEKWDCAVQLSAHLAALLLKNRLNVVYSYPLRIEDYDVILRGVSAQKPTVQAITLAPPLEVIRTNRGRRELTPRQKKRIYTIRIDTPPWGIQIDNGYQTPKETLRTVLKLIKKRAGMHLHTPRKRR